MPKFSSLDRKTRAWVVGVVVFGAAIGPLAWVWHPITTQQIGTLLYLAVGTQIAALLPIRWTHGNQYIYDPLLVATGLYAPGPGVALVAWLALFDGRVPGRDAPWWVLAFSRANTSLDNVIPSVIVAFVPQHEWWTLPTQTIAYSVLGIALNYSVTARILAFLHRTTFVSTLFQNVGGVALTSTAILNFSGGILYLLIQTPIGMLMAPGLFGFLLAVRSNVASFQRQTELKDQTLELAAQALDARDRYTESHSIRVAELAGRLGEHLDLGDKECELLRTAGALHDLGKIGIRDDILNKPGPLTDDEWSVMRRHPDIGAEMIAQHSALRQVAPLVRHHHERWNGTGYPAGLKGEAIPFGARILSVADSFDTITGARLYRRSLMTATDGVEDISRRAGQWYDPNVVDALRALHGLTPLELEDRPVVPRQITVLRLLAANPSFSKLLAATAISAVGDPLTQVAALVTVYAATHGDPRFVAAAFGAQALGTIVTGATIGGVADRIPRRRLMVSLDLTRAFLLITAPITAALWPLALIPILFVLAAINAIVQPARQAAVPAVVTLGQVGKANAVVSAVTNASNAIGFAVAGLLLSIGIWLNVSQPTSILFVGDGLTFGIAAALVLTIRALGGGVDSTRVTGSLKRAWAAAAVRPHLAVSAVAAFLLAISYPALLALAYRVSPDAGAQTYSVFEVIVSIGIFIGAVAVSRAQTIGSMRTAGAGLLITGSFALALTIHPVFLFVALALFAASFGNPIYAVANQTALLEAADQSNRGTVMATRYAVVQTAMIGGTAAGGFITHSYGPIGAYGALAVGLLLLGMFAVAAGRRTTNPLHGRQYEEAVLMSSNGAHNSVADSNGGPNNGEAAHNARDDKGASAPAEVISNRA